MTMGFVVSHKNNEARRALVPSDLKKIKNVDKLWFETGYGLSIGCPDSEYEKFGAHIADRASVLACDMIVDVKLGDADYLNELAPGKVLVGWAHAVQQVDFTSSVLNGGHTVLAWEDIFEDGRYIFYRNREVAGEAAVMHAFRYSGKMPYDCSVAIIGNGQTAKGALRVLHGLGAKVDVYGRKLEKLFTQKMYEYDVVVNCVMWDTNRTDRLIYKEDLKKFKPGTLLIDISCDPYLEIETSHPTTIDDPVYVVDGVIHYTVDNTPAMYPITVTNILSEGFCKIVDTLIEGDYPPYIQKAVVIKDGHIIQENIRRFREAKGLFCR